MPVLKSGIVFEEPDPPEPPALKEDVEVIELEAQEPKLTFSEGLLENKGPELPKVALIIDDIGYDYAIGMQLLEMPIDVTFSFLPFATYTKELESAAYKRGKTIFLHLPLEPQSNKFDPGPGALLLSDSSQEQVEKLQRCLLAVPHAVGVNNHMGSKFTENRPAMEVVMAELLKQSLYFIDSYTTSKSVGFETARSYNVKSAKRNVFLDNVIDEEHICRQLDKLVNIAKERGAGIGIAHPHRITLEALKGCTLDHGFEVEYVSILELL